MPETHQSPDQGPAHEGSNAGGVGTPLSAVQRVAMVAGPLLAVLVYLVLPATTFDETTGELLGGLTTAGRLTAAIAVLMAVWWLTEAIPIPATSLLPAALFPMLGVLPMADTASRYAHELILLFFGGFMLGLAMQRHGLHKRIALLTLSLVGTSPARLIAGFMIASAVMSAWVSNTATTLMMLPIAISVLSLLFDTDGGDGGPDGAGVVGGGGASERDRSNLSVSMLLGIAYASSIGGVTTLVGTAPNLFLSGFAADSLGLEISMARWMVVAAPLAVVFVPVCWLVLTRVLFPVSRGSVPEAGAHIARERRALGPMSGGEWVVLGVFTCTALAWVLRRPLNEMGQGWATNEEGLRAMLSVPLSALRDSTIAMGAAVLLFVLPCRVRPVVLTADWRVADQMPWGILILFGGGLALAKAISDNGVDVYLGSHLGALSGVPPFVVVLAVTAGIILLTEVTSNTAVTTASLPVIAAAAPVMGIDPIRLLVPATIAASLAFMLPVATPPNAIVFGSGRITIRQMARAGIWLNVIGVVLASVVGYFFAGYVVTPAG